MSFDGEHAAEYEFEVRRPGVEFEMNHELNNLEQREINRRVKWAREQKERAMAEEKKPTPPPKGPGDVSPEALDKLRAGMKKRDPQEKDQSNKPKKGR